MSSLAIQDNHGVDGFVPFGDMCVMDDYFQIEQLGYAEEDVFLNGCVMFQQKVHASVQLMHTDGVQTGDVGFLVYPVSGG